MEYHKERLIFSGKIGLYALKTLEKCEKANFFTGLDKQTFQRKIVNIFLPINFNICFGCSKELSH